MDSKLYGHKKMIIWQNINKTEEFVNTRILPRIPHYKRWLRRQIESACDSIGANFVEGYYSGSIPEYIRFLFYSKRSLAELRDHIERANLKSLISLQTIQDFDKICCQTLYLFSRLISSLKKKV